MLPEPIRGLPAVTLGALLGAIALDGWFADRRPSVRDLRGARRVAVTSGRDAGPGSLREAIFEADRSDEPVVLDLVARRIVLKTSLPPLTNRKGVVLDARSSRCQIDAREAAPSVEPILDIASPGSHLEGLHVRGGSGPCIGVRAPGVRLSGLSIEGCGEGVSLLDAAADAIVSDSGLTGNGIGVKVSPRASRVTLRSLRFSGSQESAIWSVSPEMEGQGLLVRGCRFENDRTSVVAVNVKVRLLENDFSGARQMAIYLSGSGAVLRSNRIRDGKAFGIVAQETGEALFEENELDGNAFVGIVLNGGNAATLRGNRLYRNGYGIAVVRGGAGRPSLLTGNLLLSHSVDGLFIAGASPIVERNRILRNAGAATRVLDLLPYDGPRVDSHPLLRENAIDGNGLDEVVRGVYRLEKPVEPIAFDGGVR